MNKEISTLEGNIEIAKFMGLTVSWKIEDNDWKKGNKIAKLIVNYVLPFNYIGYFWTHIEKNENEMACVNALILRFWRRSGEISKYHSSWDWLMPVVEKIKEYGKWTLQPGFATLELYRELAGYGNIESKRKMFSTSQMDWETENDEPVEWVFMVHHIVVKFIQWNNTQKKVTI